MVRDARWNSRADSDFNLGHIPHRLEQRGKLLRKFTLFFIKSAFSDRIAFRIVTLRDVTVTPFELLVDYQ